jgi:MFS family permease
VSLLAPQERIDEADLERGLRHLVYDGMCSQALLTLTQGAILVAFALLLGASTTVVGVIVAIGPFSNILQIPSIFLIERTGRRKAVCVLSCLLGRTLFLAVGLLPWLAPPGLRLPLLVGLLLLQFSSNAVAGCAFNSWVYDLVPRPLQNRFFARRMTWSMALGAALTLAAGVGVEVWERAHPDDPFPVYAILFSAGVLAGWLGCVALSRIPEPRMVPVPMTGMGRVIAEPFRDSRFRRLLGFTGWWTFAVNLGAPFFTVYLVRRLDLPVSWVLGLTVFSLVAHVLSLRAWGRWADRHSNKLGLAFAGLLFLLCLALWPTTHLVEGQVPLVALLLGIHALAGVSTAGVALCSQNLALREAPAGKATAYLATNSLVGGAGATLAPLIAGAATDALRAGGASVHVLGMPLSGLDLVFLGAVVVGALALRLLVRVQEEGVAKESISFTDLYSQVIRGVWQTSPIAGLRRMTGFPYFRLRRLLRRGPRDGEGPDVTRAGPPRPPDPSPPGPRGGSGDAPGPRG